VRTIAQVLHRAADKRLSTDDTPMWRKYTCCAVEDEAGHWTPLATRVLDGLRAMGCGGGIDEFSEFAPGPERQAARYAWLKFAAMIAEEQGV
jgi:hypothetical protein